MAEQEQELQPAAPSRPVVPFLLVTLAVIAVVMVLFNRVADVLRPPCENVIIDRLDSPSGDHQAVLFDRNCGATTGFSSQVSVIRPGTELPDQAGNVFVAVVGDDAASTPWGGPQVALEWTADDSLIIRHDEGARVSSSREAFDGVSVQVEVIGGGE